MVSEAAIAAWLRDIEKVNRSGPQLSAVKRKRQHLAPIDPNMATPRRNRRTPSPSKKKQQQLKNPNTDNNNTVMTAALQEKDEVDVQQTPRPFLRTSGTRRGGRAAGLTGSLARVSPFSDNGETDYSAQLMSGVVTNAPVLRPPSHISIELISTSESVSPSESASHIRSASFPLLSGASERSSPRRPKSPVRSGAALRNAEKPVHFHKFEAQNTPLDVEDLLEQLGDIDAGMCIVPHVVKDTVAGFVKKEGSRQKLRPYNINRPTDDTNGAIQELETLTEIKNNAKELQFAFEAAWNEAVHYPFLRLALRPFPSVKLHNVTKAAICSDLIPKHGNRLEKLGSKMVDYTINLLPRTDTIGNHIHNLVINQPFNLQTVNQTMYPLVDCLPCAISIETKLAGAGDGLVQLGIWSLACFSRLRDLRQQCATRQPRRQPPPSSPSSPSSVPEKEKDMISHPLVIVTSDEWVLHIAVDRGDRIDILGRVRLGDTDSWLGMYKLMKSLRALARWADGRMREWFEAEVLGMSEKAEDSS